MLLTVSLATGLGAPAAGQKAAGNPLLGSMHAACHNLQEVRLATAAGMAGSRSLERVCCAQRHLPSRMRALRPQTPDHLRRQESPRALPARDRGMQIANGSARCPAKPCKQTLQTLQVWLTAHRPDSLAPPFHVAGTWGRNCSSSSLADGADLGGCPGTHPSHDCPSGLVVGGLGEAAGRKHLGATPSNPILKLPWRAPGHPPNT